MDKFNPRETRKIQEAYENVISEQKVSAKEITIFKASKTVLGVKLPHEAWVYGTKTPFGHGRVWMDLGPGEYDESFKNENEAARWLKTQGYKFLTYEIAETFKPKVHERIGKKAFQKKFNEETYKEFFTKKLKKFGVDEPDKLPDDKKKQFYDEVDKEWKGKNEKPEANESIKSIGKSVKTEINESAGSRLHSIFGDLFDFLENNFFGIDASIVEKKINVARLTKETDKLYRSWQKELKGKGLIGW